jgi:16S rRNA (adenine1518-N6/adenine1519-N6)-dimethyltransferase
MPRPKIGSAVIKLTKHKKPPVDVLDAKLLFRIIRASFNQRRKTLINGLYNNLDGMFDKEQLKQAIENIGLKVNVRGETLSLEEFSNLANELYKIN